MIKRHFRKRTVAFAAVAGLAAAGVSPLLAAAADEDALETLHDFESGNAPFFAWGDAGFGLENISETGLESWPENPDNTQVLSYGFDLGGDNGFGGIGFTYEGDQAPRDWSGYDGVQFWVYGDGGSGEFQVEILDAKDAETTPYDRWDTTVPVGDGQWRLVQLPWDAFGYATDFQDDGAPNDGALDLTFVRGLVFPASAGTGTVKIDDISLFSTDGAVAPSLSLPQTQLNVTEGETVEIPVALNRAAEDDVTFSWTTVDGEAVATADYVGTSGTLTVSPGETSVTLPVRTVDNDEADGNRAFTVTLSEPQGATLGAATATITIRDNDSQDNTEAPDYSAVVDFESDLEPADADAVPMVGWYTAQGADNVPSYERLAGNDRPNAEPGNTVLELGLNSSSWAVLVDAFSEDGEWAPQDWSAREGLGFWMKGTNSGATMFVDVLDNRSPGSEVDDAERFSIRFADDWSGWKFVQLPFADFARKDVGNNAPQDGFTLSEVHGFGIGVEQTATTMTPVILLDDISVYGDVDPYASVRLGFSSAITEVVEGETAQVELSLTRALDHDVTFSYATAEATDRTSTEGPAATLDRDYLAAQGAATIPAGERTTTITVPTIDDDKPEVTETFLVRLSEAEGVQLADNPLGRVAIIDNDEASGFIDDFEEGTGLLRSIGASGLSEREIDAESGDGYDGQSRYEKVLDVTGDGYTRDFAQPEDWSDAEGLGFWYRGTGDGNPVTVTVKDNAAAPSHDPEKWELVWSDEFDAEAGSPADPRYWTYETGGWGWGNDESQFYTDSTDNAAHDGEGNFVITAREIADPAAAGMECWYGDCTHTSARLITEKKVEVMHGRIEARAKLPVGTGIWPAIWSLGNDFREVGWPQTGEIDIMEFVGKLPNEVFGTIHGPGYSGSAGIGNTHRFDEPIGGGWFTFAVEWDEGEIQWTVTPEGGEEIVYHEAVPADVDPNEWVYEHPFTLLMNVAVGGNFGGVLGDDLVFPQELTVDYIRVFHDPDSAEVFEADFVDDTAGWSFVEVPFADFERAAAQPEGAPDDGLGLTQVNGYGLSTGRSAGANGAGVQAAAVAAPTGSVSVDRVQILAELSPVDPEPTPAPTPVEPEPTPAPTPVEPEPTPVPTPADPTPVPDPTTPADPVGTLPATGSDVPIGLIIGAVALLLVGGGVVAVGAIRSRRRNDSD